MNGHNEVRKMQGKWKTDQMKKAYEGWWCHEEGKEWGNENTVEIEEKKEQKDWMKMKEGKRKVKAIRDYTESNHVQRSTG